MNNKHPKNSKLNSFPLGRQGWDALWEGRDRIEKPARVNNHNNCTLAGLSEGNV